MDPGERREGDSMQAVLSIIIPIYNVAAYLEQCLESVIGQMSIQESGAVEVFLIDDGSTDGSGEIADRYAEKISGIRVWHGPNAGVAAARNTGMRQAQGKWLYFMDSDDWLDDSGIALLCKMAEKYPDVDMILFDAYQHIGTKERIWEHFAQPARWKSRSALRRLQRGVLYYPMDFPTAVASLAAPWDKLYRREFLLHQKITFREELRVLDDMIFNMEVLGNATYVAYDKSRVCHYRYVGTSITNKYQADRVFWDRKVWDYIEWYQTRQFAKVVWETDEKEAFRQAYYCRLIRSFAICCRIHFYHRENKKSWYEKQQTVRKVVESKPYSEAVKKVSLCHLEWRLKVMVILIRCRLYGGVYLLHMAETALQKGKTAIAAIR